MKIKTEVICMGAGQWRAKVHAISKDGECIATVTGRTTSREWARAEVKDLRAQLLGRLNRAESHTGR